MSGGDGSALWRIRGRVVGRCKHEGEKVTVAKCLLLESERANGESVGTPVWFAELRPVSYQMYRVRPEWRLPRRRVGDSSRAVRGRDA
jgi:hypothetical protein